MLYHKIFIKIKIYNFRCATSTLLLFFAMSATRSSWRYHKFIKIPHCLVGCFICRSSSSSFFQTESKLQVCLLIHVGGCRQASVLWQKMNHKTTMSQKWLQKNLPIFILMQDLPSGSSNLNQLDYPLWQILEIAGNKRHRDKDALKLFHLSRTKIPLKKVCEWTDA